MSKFDVNHPVPCVYWKNGAYRQVKKNVWTTIGKTLEEALAEYAKQQEANKGAGKFPDLIEKTFLHHCKVKNLSPNTKAQYRIAANVLKRKFKLFDGPDQVKGKHVAKIKVDGAEHPNMTNRIISLLRTLFGYWLEAQLCESNPCIGIARHTEAKRKRLISLDEWWAIYEQAGPRLRVIMKVAFLTGQRIGDVLTIERSQLTDIGIEFTQQKTGKQLTVKWSPDLREAVSDALALHGTVPAPTLFIGRRKNRAAPDYRSVLLQWHDACEAAKVDDALPNDQRAQSLTAAKKQGKNPTALAGHATEAMTDRYLRDRDSDVVDGPTLRQQLDS